MQSSEQRKVNYSKRARLFHPPFQIKVVKQYFLSFFFPFQKIFFYILILFCGNIKLHYQSLGSFACILMNPVAEWVKPFPTLSRGERSCRERLDTFFRWRLQDHEYLSRRLCFVCDVQADLGPFPTVNHLQPSPWCPVWIVSQPHYVELSVLLSYIDDLLKGSSDGLII